MSRAPFALRARWGNSTRPVHPAPRSTRRDPATPPTIYLTLPADQAGHTIDIRWRLTSTGADGWRDGEMTFAVGEEPVDLAVSNDTG
jgi:hypothetical protein